VFEGISWAVMDYRGII